jgi:hypothetical protein
MKDLLIGCASGYKWDQLKYWVNSAKQANINGDIVLILLSCDEKTVRRLVEERINVVMVSEMPENGIYEHKTPLAPHVERFFHIQRYLRATPTRYRYVLTTDVRDVVFQSNPFDWVSKNIGSKQLVASSEAIKYENEPWGNENLLQTFGPYIHDVFKKKLVFNVGVVAGEHEAVQDLCTQVFAHSVNRPIPIVDQAVYNFMVHQEPYRSTTMFAMSEDGWAAQLGTTGDPTKLEQFTPHLVEAIPILGDVVTTSRGVPYAIVHQYDRVPSLKSMFEEKFK